jgi:hypothetical protein
MLTTSVTVVTLLVGPPAVGETGSRDDTGGRAPSGAPVGEAIDLGHGRWSTVPLAPLGGRWAAVTAWTGHELLVWGGAASHEPYRATDQVFATGAAYDPARHRWRKLAPAPISPRAAAASVWTGHELIVWGGFDDITSAHPHAVSDGASYDPTTDSWSLLPAALLAARAAPIATWTGNRMILLGGRPAAGPFLYTDGAAYDPATRTWTPIPAPVDPLGRKITWTNAVATDHGVLAWAGWTERLDLAGRMGSYRGGGDMFSYDPASSLWTYVPPTADALAVVGSSLWTGDAVFAVGQMDPCPGDGVPCAGGDVTVRIYHPATNTWTVVPEDKDPSYNLGGPLTLLGHHVLTFAVNDSGPGNSATPPLLPPTTC